MSKIHLLLFINIPNCKLIYDFCCCDELIMWSILILDASLETLQCLVSTGDLTKTFELRVQDECLNSDPSQRPHMSSLLQDRLFK